MFSLSPGTPGLSAQMPRIHKSTETPVDGRAVQRVDDLLVDEAVELEAHVRRPPGAGVRSFLVDALDQCRAQGRGATSSRWYDGLSENPDRRLNRSLKSSPTSESNVSRPKSSYSRAVRG